MTHIAENLPASFIFAPLGEHAEQVLRLHALTPTLGRVATFVDLSLFSANQKNPYPFIALVLPRRTTQSNP